MNRLSHMSVEAARARLDSTIFDVALTVRGQHLFALALSWQALRCYWSGKTAVQQLHQRVLQETTVAANESARVWSVDWTRLLGMVVPQDCLHYLHEVIAPWRERQRAVSNPTAYARVAELLRVVSPHKECYTSLLDLLHSSGVPYSLHHLVLDSSVGRGLVTGFDERTGRALVLGKPAEKIVTAHERWVTPEIHQMAQAIACSFDLETGELDVVGLAALADALEEKGCDCVELLQHLRGYHSCSHFHQEKTESGQCAACQGAGYIQVESPRYLGSWGLWQVLGY